MRRRDGGKRWPEYDVVDVIFAVAAPYEPFNDAAAERAWGPRARWDARGAELLDLAVSLGIDVYPDCPPLRLWGLPRGGEVLR